MTEFEPAEFRHFSKIYDILSSGISEDSAYTITSVLAWQSIFKPKVYLEDDFALMTIEEGDKVYFNSPLVRDRKDYIKAVERLEELGADKIHLVLDWQLEILKERGYGFKEERSMAEYLYSTEELSELKGKKYHGKRNFINSFGYPYILREYRKEDYCGLMELLDIWGKISGLDNDASWSYISDTLKMSDYDLEKEAIVRTLEDPKAYRIFADVLEIDGKIEGFAAGEIMPNNIGVIYFEKGNTQFKGIYQVLDNIFIKAHFKGVPYINKQEDMGLPGLRQSKLSYHPVKLIERYTAYKDIKED